MRSLLLGVRWVMVMAAWAAAVVAAPARGDLALHIGADKTQYLVDERLFVRVAVRNAGHDDVRILRTLDPALGVLTFEIVAPGEEEPHRYMPQVQAAVSREGLEKAAIRLTAGAEYSAVVNLTYEMGEVSGSREPGPVPVLSQPGEYRLRAQYSIPEDWPAGPLTIRSSELRIVAEEPQGVDQQAHQALYDCELPYEMRPWNVATEQQECYERVAREYPQSGYAVHARYSLGEMSHFDGVQRKRGTPAGAAALARGAALDLSVAEQVGDTAFGLGALRAAGKCFANLGQIAQAQHEFERCFVSPAATTEDRVDALVRIGKLERGLLRRDSGGVSRIRGRPLALPLREFAGAMGLEVGWDAETKMVTVLGPKVVATLRPGEDAIIVNGNRWGKMRVSVKEGRTLVSPSVIRALLAAQWGKDGAEPW